MLKACIFDFDGTCCDTLPLCVESFRLAIRDLSGKECTDREIMETFGPTEDGTIRAFLPDMCEKGLAAYWCYYGKLHDEMCPNLFEGMEELLTGLKKQGVLLGLVTGKGWESLAISLEHFQMTGLFDEIQTGSPYGSRKPEAIAWILSKHKIQKEEAIYIGDTVNDIRDAKIVGVPILSAAWSKTADRMALASNAPDFLATNIQMAKQYLYEQLKCGRK